MVLVVCLFSCLWPFFYFIINWFLLVVLFHNNWAVFPQRFLSRWLRPDLCAPSLIPSLSLTLKQSARTLASTSVWTLFRNKNLYCNLAQIFIWLPFRVFRGMASEPWSSLGPTWVARALTSDRLLWWQSWHSWDPLFLPERHQWAL